MTLDRQASVVAETTECGGLRAAIIDRLGAPHCRARKSGSPGSWARRSLARLRLRQRPGAGPAEHRRIIRPCHNGLLPRFPARRRALRVLSPPGRIPRHTTGVRILPSQFQPSDRHPVSVTPHPDHTGMRFLPSRRGLECGRLPPSRRYQRHLPDLPQRHQCHRQTDSASGNHRILRRLPQHPRVDGNDLQP